MQPTVRNSSFFGWLLVWVQQLTYCNSEFSLIHSVWLDRWFQTQNALLLRYYKRRYRTFGNAWNADIRVHIRVCVECIHSAMRARTASVGEHELHARKAVSSAVWHVTATGSGSTGSVSSSIWRVPRVVDQVCFSETGLERESATSVTKEFAETIWILLFSWQGCKLCLAELCLVTESLGLEVTSCHSWCFWHVQHVVIYTAVSRKTKRRLSICNRAAALSKKLF